MYSHSSPPINRATGLSTCNDSHVFACVSRRPKTTKHDRATTFLPRRRDIITKLCTYFVHLHEQYHCYSSAILACGEYSKIMEKVRQE